MASTHHYDVIIIGAGFAGRTVAVLLARKGLRVFTLAGPSVQGPAFLPLSPAVEKLAAAIDFPSNKLRPAKGFQIITPEARLDFHGNLTLEEELARELPGSDEQVLNRLRKLDDWGRRLEAILLRPNHIPSLGLLEGFAFRRRLLSNGLATKGLKRKLSSLLDGVADHGAHQVLSALFAGLSLADPRNLTIAEAALLWHAASRPQVLAGGAFQDAVERRFQQSHIQSRPFADLAALKGSGKRLQSVLFRDGTQLGATHFLIDQFPDPSLWQGRMKVKATPAPIVSELWHLTEIAPLPSSLLATRVMLAGSPPLLLTFLPQNGKGLEATVDQAGCFSQPLIEADQLRRRLEPVLPFADYRLDRRRRQAGMAFPRSGYPEFFGPKRLSPGILYCGASARSRGMIDIHTPLAAWATAEALLKKKR